MLGTGQVPGRPRARQHYWHAHAAGAFLARSCMVALRNASQKCKAATAQYCKEKTRREACRVRQGATRRNSKAMRTRQNASSSEEKNSVEEEKRRLLAAAPRLLMWPVTIGDQAFTHSTEQALIMRQCDTSTSRGEEEKAQD